MAEGPVEDLMRFDTTTRAQRLAHDYDELTHDYEHDLSLDELLEVQDAEFRHWDQYTFARSLFVGTRANGGGPPGQGSGSPPTSFARGTNVPGSHARDRAAATSSGSSGGGPHNSPQPTPASPQHNGQAGSDAGADTVPPGRSGVANSSWETWVWAA